MSDCDVMRESMPLLLTESLDPAQRERTHQHIETCAACGDAWSGYRETWSLLATLPEVEPRPELKNRFLASIGENVKPFAPAKNRRTMRWLAQAAAVVIIAGGSYFAGHRTVAAPQNYQTPATVNSQYSIAESRVLPAAALSPTIEGRPNIENVTFADTNPDDQNIDLSFDVTSHVTVTGRPTDKSMVRLLRYVLENENNKISPSRSQAIDWVRTLYSRPGNANSEITEALANVLRNDSHEGVRIKAVETLNRMPFNPAADTREALIQALKSDPNPAVRIKAVEALANLARSGATLDAATVDTLRQKAVQDNENVYVRVKAAEALGSIHP